MDDRVIEPKDLIYYKEKLYFWIVTSFSIISYILFTFSIIGLAILAALFLFSFLLHGIAMGQIRTNAVKLSASQFPEINTKVEELCKKMKLKKVPDVYVMQSGGILNAFATRFFRKHMVIVYSEIFDLIEDGLDEELYFVLAHELAHIKRNHLGKMAFILPSMWIPGVAETYLRACEYTCDRYAAYYTGNLEASKNSLMILAIGKKLYYRTDQTEFMKQINREKGFFVWLSGILSTHPPLPKRIHEIKIYFGEPEPIILPKKKWALSAGLVLVSGIFLGGIFYEMDNIKSFLSFSNNEDLDAEALDEPSDIPPIIQAVINDDKPKVEKLAKEGQDVDEEDYTGYTAMDWAIKAKNAEMVKILLKSGADPNNETSYSMTPLMTAAENGRPEIIKILHSAGAKLNYQDTENGMTSLIYAAEGEDEKTVKVLIQLGADPKKMDYSNMTPYMHALDIGHENIAELLKPKK
ncbi:M48 family metallopeptidase [Peribacillus kribbensis]|uniref:M48 family metallopeptidase n=1 Tax=Peribacillus kribbensis TaxID=356658 RepID=UPI00040D956F|nr:ankyrin repeat domain-containing protein [Peribacillus kribbensis]